MFKSGFIKLNKGEKAQVKSPKAANDRGVVYLGHVPHGFYENEMKQYFSQFGDVTNINIPKSKKTGKARGFAFVEFMYPEVAKVVAETMNNYLMHKKILVAKYLPPNEVKSNTFWRCNKNRIPLTIKNRSIQRKAMERLLGPEKDKQIKELLNKRLRSLQKKMKSKGIEYDIQVYNPEESTNNNVSEENTSMSEIKDNNDNTNLSETCSEPDTSVEVNNENNKDGKKMKTLPKTVKKNKMIKAKGHNLRIKS